MDDAEADFRLCAVAESFSRPLERNTLKVCATSRVDVGRRLDLPLRELGSNVDPVLILAAVAIAQS